MSKYKKGVYANVNPTTETKDLLKIAEKTGNLYEALAIISRRAVQINTSIKEELHAKLEEFATHTDNLEEVFENREQIEISKFYEKLPNAVNLAMAEFMQDEIYVRVPEEEIVVVEEKPQRKLAEKK